MGQILTIAKALSDGNRLRALMLLRNGEWTCDRLPDNADGPAEPQIVPRREGGRFAAFHDFCLELCEKRAPAVWRTPDGKRLFRLPPRPGGRRRAQDNQKVY